MTTEAPRMPASKQSSAPRQAPSDQTQTAAPMRRASVSRGASTKYGQKAVVYGTGGVGKTELLSLLPAAGIDVLFLDLENGSQFLDVARVDPPPATWEEVRAVLHDRELLAAFQGVVIDSLTRLEELAMLWTIQNVPHEKGDKVKSIEGYGYGKGYMHLYETFLQVLGDLDAVARSGRHVFATAHDCVAEISNPEGENWLQSQPRLISPPSGKGSIRHRVKEWCDHLFYLGFDKKVSSDKRAVGDGTRTIHTGELPSHWAKSRRFGAAAFPYHQGDPSLWTTLFAKE